MDKISKVIKTNKHIKVLKISWTQIDNICRQLAKYVDWTLYDGIYGVPRGGMIVAVILSHLTNKPIVQLQQLNNRILVVDDILDSGDTLYNIKSKYPGIDFLCLFTKKKSYVIKYYGKYINIKTWVKFPWEIG